MFRLRTQSSMRGADAAAFGIAEAGAAGHRAEGFPKPGIPSRKAPPPRSATTTRPIASAHPIRRRGDASSRLAPTGVRTAGRERRALSWRLACAKSGSEGAESARGSSGSEPEDTPSWSSLPRREPEERRGCCPVEDAGLPASSKASASSADASIATERSSRGSSLGRAMSVASESSSSGIGMPTPMIVAFRFSGGDEPRIEGGAGGGVFDDAGAGGGAFDDAGAGATPRVVASLLGARDGVERGASEGGATPGVVIGAGGTGLGRDAPVIA
jgi:hypothetical protein